MKERDIELNSEVSASGELYWVSTLVTDSFMNSNTHIKSFKGTVTMLGETREVTVDMTVAEELEYREQITEYIAAVIAESFGIDPENDSDMEEFMYENMEIVFPEAHIEYPEDT